VGDFVGISMALWLSLGAGSWGGAFGSFIKVSVGKEHGKWRDRLAPSLNVPRRVTLFTLL
jgi:hypothetical protein